jgi:hypothetical protein
MHKLCGMLAHSETREGAAILLSNIQYNMIAAVFYTRLLSTAII